MMSKFGLNRRAVDTATCPLSNLLLFRGAFSPVKSAFSITRSFGALIALSSVRSNVPQLDCFHTTYVETITNHIKSHEVGDQI